MCLKNEAKEGECLTNYDPVDEILFGQWRDNKVVGEETVNC